MDQQTTTSRGCTEDFLTICLKELDRFRSSLDRIVPDRQRASDPSLRARLTAAHERIRELQAENRRLRTALAEAIGVNRTTATRHSRPLES